MGYCRTLTGWYKAADPIDLRAIIDELDATVANASDRPSLLLRVTGRHRNYISTATDAKEIGNHIKWMIVIAERCRRGTGIITVTGEVCGDGNDRFIELIDRDVHDVGAHSLYMGIWDDPVKTFILRWSGYGGLDHSIECFREKLIVDDVRTASPFREKANIKGLMFLPRKFGNEAMAFEASVQHLVNEIGTKIASPFHEIREAEYLLIGEQETDTNRILSKIEGFTQAHVDSRALLYVSDDSESTQTILAVEGGRSVVCGKLMLRR